jgi:hypothetical protein
MGDRLYYLTSLEHRFLLPPFLIWVAKLPRARRFVTALSLPPWAAVDRLRVIVVRAEPPLSSPATVQHRLCSPPLLRFWAIFRSRPVTD